MPECPQAPGQLSMTGRPDPAGTVHALPRSAGQRGYASCSVQWLAAPTSLLMIGGLPFKRLCVAKRTRIIKGNGCNFHKLLSPLNTGGLLAVLASLAPLDMPNTCHLVGLKRASPPVLHDIPCKVQRPLNLSVAIVMLVCSDMAGLRFRPTATRMH